MKNTLILSKEQAELEARLWKCGGLADCSAESNFILQMMQDEQMTVGPYFNGPKHEGWVAYSHARLAYDEKGEYIEGSDRAKVGTGIGTAVARCYVASRLGEEVDIPDEFLS